jgi:hypothetical protein
MLGEPDVGMRLDYLFEALMRHMTALKGIEAPQEAISPALKWGQPKN